MGKDDINHFALSLHRKKKEKKKKIFSEESEVNLKS